jgi:hypothetical protein
MVGIATPSPDYLIEVDAVAVVDGSNQSHRPLEMKEQG